MKNLFLRLFSKGAIDPTVEIPCALDKVYTRRSIVQECIQQDWNTIQTILGADDDDTIRMSVKFEVIIPALLAKELAKTALQQICKGESNE